MNFIKSGEDFDESWFDKPCKHPQHTPPMHLFIPVGQEHHHKCPGCGTTHVIRGSEAKLQVDIDPVA